MARYKCPCCGESYNGKRCGNCYYESFSNETSCSEHHKEVLFDDGNTVRTAPRQSVPGTVRQSAQTPRPAASYPRTKKKNTSPAVRIIGLIAVFVLLSGFRACLADLSTRSFRDLSDSYIDSIQETVAPMTLPADGTVLYDKNGLTVVADWRDGDAYTGEILIVGENHTDQNVQISANDIIINGYHLPGSYMHCAPSANGSATTYFRLNQSDMEYAGIETVEEISFWLNIFDTDSYDRIDETDYITLRADVPEGFTQPVDDSGTLLWEQDGIRIISKGYRPSTLDPDNFYDGTIIFFLENTTDQTLVFTTTPCNVNAESSDLNLYAKVQPGKRMLAEMYLYCLEDLGIKSLSEIEYIDLAFEVKETENWDTIVSTDILYLDVTE